MSIKNLIKKALRLFRLDLTKNLEYDRLTQKILRVQLSHDNNCVDVGCHKGEILDLFLKNAPQGTHFAFEPIPYLFKDLVKTYGKSATIFPFALADRDGETTFQVVKNAPAYSGIKRRKYDIRNPEIEEITVQVRTLDEVISAEKKVDFIKIDVEGAEFGVLKGATRILKNDKPMLLFEFGKGASDYYGTTPEEFHRFLTVEMGYSIYTLRAFLKMPSPLSEVEFEKLYTSNQEYYFVAVG